MTDIIKKPPDKSEDEEDPKLGVRSLRRIENAKYNEYVIKMSLNGSLSKPFKKTENSKIFISNIQERVLEVSKANHRLSLAYNLLIKDCIQNKTPYQIFLMLLLLDKLC